MRKRARPKTFDRSAAVRISERLARLASSAPASIRRQGRSALALSNRAIVASWCRAAPETRICVGEVSGLATSPATKADTKATSQNILHELERSTFLLARLFDAIPLHST